MNIERYITITETGLFRRGECFPLLNMHARLEYNTAESAGFSIDHVSKSGVIHVPEGYLDVHHPCAGHIKTHLRCKLPIKYLEPEQMRQIVQQTFNALGIPPDETYYASFVVEKQNYVLQQRVNREGITDID